MKWNKKRDEKKMKKKMKKLNSMEELKMQKSYNCTFLKMSMKIRSLHVFQVFHSS